MVFVDCVVYDNEWVGEDIYDDFSQEFENGFVGKIEFRWLIGDQLIEVFQNIGCDKVCVGNVFNDQ